MNKEKMMDMRMGRICEVQRKLYTLESECGAVKAQLRGAFYREDMDQPVIGDYVMFDYNPVGVSFIREVLERKSILKRPDQAGHAAGFVKNMKEQLLAANFDYVFIVVSLNNDYNLNRITRYITVTLQGGAKPVVILSKADLCKDKEKYMEEVSSISEKADVCLVSALTGEGMESLFPYLKEGSTIVLAGSSGVGKSTIVNAISGKNLMKVSEIRESDSKGHHTTTHRQLFTLPSGVTIIDSPGIRELGMCDVEEGLENTFSDIAELIAQCRFTDCRHMTEPGCAIRGAIREQTLSKSRWELYCSLYEENKLSTVKSGGERSRKTKSNLSGFKCRKGEECDRSERFR